MKRIYCDFNKCSDSGLIPLNCLGSYRDIEELKPGNFEQVIFYTDDADENGNPCLLVADGIIQFDRQNWWAYIYWDTVTHVGKNEISIPFKR